MTSITTSNFMEKFSQYLDNQDYEAAYEFLVSEQKKLFKQQTTQSHFQEKGKVLIDAFLELTDPIDRYTLDLDLELECCLRAEEIHNKGWSKPDDTFIKIKSYIVYILNALRRLDESRACSEYILSICDEYSTDPYKDKMEAYHSIAFAYEENEELEMALRYYKQAELHLNKMIATNPDEPYSDHKGSTTNALACVYVKLQRYEEGKIKALEAMTTMGESHPYYPYPVFNYTRALYFQGEYQKAIDGLESIRIKYKDLPNILVRTLPALADAYDAIGDDEKTEACLLEALTIFDENKAWHQSIQLNLRRLAKFYSKKGDYKKALHFIQQADDNCRMPRARFIVLGIKSNIQCTHNQYFDAYETIKKADILADQIRRSYKTQASRLLLAEQAKDLYERGIEIAFLLYQKTNDNEYVKMAFRFAEKSKAILLLHEVKHLEAMLSSDIPAEILKREKDILIHLNTIERLLGGEKKIPEKTQTKLKDERFNLRRELDQLIETLERDYPDYHQQKYNTEPTSIADLQVQLNDNQLIISYFVGEECIYLFEISKRDFVMKKIGNSADILPQVTAFNALITNPTTHHQDYDKQAATLYNTLLANALTNENTEKLIILPDGILAQLPFEALTIQAQSEASDFHELSYLIHHYEVAYHFSATLWHYGKKKKITKKTVQNFVGFAPMYSGEVADEQVAEGMYRACTYRGETCHQLPFAKKEVEEVAQFFDAKEAEIYIDDKASKNNFIQKSAAARYVHIAAHGFYSTDKETDCYIQFSPTETEDIKLTIKDIQTLHLNAHLVVLSCCNTGVGAYKKGESMLALNRSFVAAGAENVISTLFKVPDALAAELMIAMYESHLSEAQAISPALRQAKRQIIANQHVTPIAWCGYQLIGF